MTVEERNKILTDNLMLIHHLIQNSKFHKIDQKNKYYEDIFQECCLRIIKKLDETDYEKFIEDPTLYFFRAVSSVISYYCHKKKKEKNICYLEDEYTLFKDDIDKTLLDVLSQDNYDNSNYNKDIIDYIKSLPTEKLNIINEHYIQGKTFTDIGKKYGCSPYFIKKQLNSELENLRILIHEKFGNDMYLHCSF